MGLANVAGSVWLNEVRTFVQPFLCSCRHIVGRLFDTQNELNGLFSLAGSGDDHLVVILKGAQPALDICSRVLETPRSFDAQFVHQDGCAHLGYQLFLGVVFASEPRRRGQAIQPTLVSSGVSNLMKGCRVILSDLRELLPQRQVDFIGGGAVKCFILLFVNDPAAGTLAVIRKDSFCL